MACRGGAAAYGLADSYGALAPGQLADMLVVDLASPFVAPVHRVESALVFNIPPRELRDVIVNGKVLVRDMQVTVASETQILAEANAAAARLFTRAGITTRARNPARCP